MYPPFLFSFRGNICQNNPFGKPPLCQPPKNNKLANASALKQGSNSPKFMECFRGRHRMGAQFYFIYPAEKKAHKHKLFALVNVQMAVGQTAGCPRVNRAKKFMCSPRNTGNTNFSLRLTGGLSQGCPDFQKVYVFKVYVPFPLSNLCGSLGPFFMQQTEPVLPENLQPHEGNPLKHRLKNREKRVSLRAQRLKKFKILKFSSEIEHFKRAAHQNPFFCGKF